MNLFAQKLKEIFYSVAPITGIVLISHFTLTPLAMPVLGRFLIGAALIVLGLSTFLVGVDLGISPIGHLMGGLIARSNRIWILVLAGLGLGFFISVAEPDLHILAGQVASVSGGILSKPFLVIVVSIGIAVLLVVGLIRIVESIPLYKVLTVLYLIILGLALFTSKEFLAISFDASGATTGALTVPFIMALALGISTMKRDSKASEKDSFGLVGIASTGAIIAVMVMGILFKVEGFGETDTLPPAPLEASLTAPFLQKFPILLQESFVALLPISLMFIILQVVSFKLPRRSFSRILKGLIYSCFGLTIFLLGVNGGFLQVGSEMGSQLVSFESKVPVVIVGFVVGLLTILAEPAVHVLTHQIEDVTAGYVKRSYVLLSLSLGVGVAVMLSVLRILLPNVHLWQYLLPGYIIGIGLMYITPKLFVGIAFDSGGVASGPMTATFVLAFTQGVASATQGADVLRDGFGVIAMVALTPVIALQVLGLMFKLKSDKSDKKGES